jgi:hypothetical protein
MSIHFDLTDAEFELAFKERTLDPTLFTHEAHLRLAWIHVRKYGVEHAIENINQQLLQFVDHVGARDKFNKTVTVAAIRAVNHFINKSKSESFADFIQEFPRLKYNFKELLAFHYGYEIFKSEKAKKEYIEPDLLPF